MKRYELIVIVLLLISIGGGCTILKNATNVTSEKDLIIPLLTYEKDIGTNKLKANLSYWDLNTGEIDMDKEILYTMELAEQNDRIEPIAWDGTNLLLYEKATPNDIGSKYVKIVDDYPMNNIVGRNVRFEQNLDKDGNIKDYTIYLSTEDGTIEKKGLFLYKSESNDITIETFPSWVDFNKQTGEITFICVDSLMSCSKIYVAKSNIDSINEINWNIIELDNEIISGGQNAPSVNTSVLIGDKYYIQSYTDIGIGGLAEINVKNKTSKVLKRLMEECGNIVEEGKFKPEYLGEIKPVGSFKEILILSVPISTDTNLEYLMCAYKNDKFLSAIHLKRDGVWDVINSAKTIVSTVDISSKDLELRFGEYISFPFPGGWY